MTGVTMYRTQLNTRQLGQTGLDIIDEELDEIEGGTR